MKTYIIHSGYTNTIAGKIYEDKKGRYTSEILTPKDKHDYPVDLFGPNRSWVGTDNHDEIKRWLESRVVPITRQFLDDMLIEQGLDHWELDTLLKLNNGKTVNDKYSVEILE